MFWYSHLPHLTLDRVRTNALIHDGLARANSDSAARAWIACFGSMQRPDAMVETHEVQSIVFRGLPSRQWTENLVLELPEDRAKARAFLQELLGGSSAKDLPRLSFGELISGGTSTGNHAFIAFSRLGLEHLGLAEGADNACMESFPYPFLAGMRARHRVLGDEEPAPGKSRWRWTDRGSQAADGAVHAILIVYGTEKAAEAANASVARLEALGGKCHQRVSTAPRQFSLPGAEDAAGCPGKWRTDIDHFGFRDGISQPAILGTVMAERALARDTVIRGRSYESPGNGPAGEPEQGLFFVALCADLERQYEFVQQQWINSGEFHGLHRETDPLTGNHAQTASTYTIPTASGPIQLNGMQRYVEVIGGGYFFLPSLAALHFLCTL